MTVKKFSKKKDGNKYISDHFQVKEFACADGSDKILIDVDYVTGKLEKIRKYFNKPLTITSAYRTTSYNSRCGGISNSAHCKGRAFDISVKDTTIKKVAIYADKIGCKCVIRYDNLSFVHIDSRDSYRGVTNSNGTRSVVDSFYTPSPKYKKVNVTNGANVRANPSATAKRITTYKYGTKVRIYGVRGAWTAVNAAKTHWIKTSLLK